jgi:protein-tyrosine phosphatase
MAAALCGKALAEHLGCQREELLQRGFLVQSAGPMAMMGAGAAPEAQEAVKELGVDLANHQTQPLTQALVGHADFLVVMTRSHLNWVLARFGGVGPSPRLLSREEEDLPDPVGCDQYVYRRCACEIERHLAGLIPEIVGSNRIVERPEQ